MCVAHLKGLRRCDGTGKALHLSGVLFLSQEFHYFRTSPHRQSVPLEHGVRRQLVHHAGKVMGAQLQILVHNGARGQHLAKITFSALVTCSSHEASHFRARTRFTSSCKSTTFAINHIFSAHLRKKNFLLQPS
uniref:(northern house mosquito) hypothetical protein n=1 Tax=Culex pipiens TaxID=7175 RepID=A0A8D8B1B4_CULPI